MSVRDERIFPLCAPLTSLPKIGPKSAAQLNARGFQRVIDLLLHLPRDGIDRTPSDTVKGAELPGTVTVKVKVVSHHPGRGKTSPYRVFVDDAALRFQLVFFRANSDYLKQALPVGEDRIVSGEAEFFENQVQMTHPDYILRPGQDALPEFEPVYPATAGMSTKVLRSAIQAGLERISSLEEWIPRAVQQDQNWPRWHDALKTIHTPRGNSDLSLTSLARLRLAFDELFAHALSVSLGRRARKREDGFSYTIDRAQVEQASAALPFDMTTAQKLALEEILTDLGKPFRMNRLLQGDVGSGKTAVGFLSAVAMASSGFQTVVMAPTEVLANQLVVEFRTWGEKVGLKVCCLTGKVTGAHRRDTLDRVAQGQIDILIGTHAVFQDKVQFHRLGLAIIDEQHRFGVMQRQKLGAKGEAVDILIMTATPIPRSLALSHFGDMSVSNLFEKPAGRHPIQTVILPASRIDDVVERLRAAVAEGRQAYWVCPLVQQSAVSERMAAETRYTFLKKALGADNVALIHGQMSTQEKEQALESFLNGAKGVLVATTVIEVGVNVPNATIIVIEGANGFGLAQLHQLRGRVGRSDQASVCVLLYDNDLTKTAEARLRALRDTNDGFELAELDLQQRGAGDVVGLAQSGFPRFRVAVPEAHGALFALAQDAAKLLLETDPDLSSAEGQAAQTLLHLTAYEDAIKLLNVG